MRDDPPGICLVTRAQTGDQQAWDLLVERYAPLVWSICRRYRLGGPDAEDVGQNVWLRLADQLDRIRDPAALPGRLATTTSRECAKALRAPRRPHAAGRVLQAKNIPDARAATVEQELEKEQCGAASGLVPRGLIITWRTTDPIARDLRQIRIILRAARRKKLRARTSPGCQPQPLPGGPGKGQADLICEQGRCSWWT